MNKKGFIYTFLGVVFMSLESLIIKLSSLSGYNFAFFFNFFMMLSMAIMITFKNKSIKALIPVDKIIAFSGLFGALSNFCYISALKLLHVGSVIFIISSSPIVCAILSFLYFKIKTPKVIILSAIITLVGMYFVVNDVSFDSVSGVLFAFGSLFCFSNYFVFLCAAKGNDSEKSVNIFYMGLFGMLFALAFANFDQISGISGIAWAFLMGFIVTPISRLLISVGSSYLLAAEIGLLLVLDSVFAPIFAYFFLSEDLTITTLFGGVCIVGSVVLYILVNNSKK